jgi:hypothetical protein
MSTFRANYGVDAVHKISEATAAEIVSWKLQGGAERKQYADLMKVEQLKDGVWTEIRDQK